MTTTLSDMTVTEAASLALELIIYGEYVDSKEKKYSWREPFTGTFDEYLKQYMTDDIDYDDDEEDYTNLDQNLVWQNRHGESGEGTRDGWTGKVVTSYGGEGEGDQYWMVVSVSDGETTRYFRKDGWYASYDGGYLDGDTYEVKPVERLIKFYE